MKQKCILRTSSSARHIQTPPQRTPLFFCTSPSGKKADYIFIYQLCIISSLVVFPPIFCTTQFGWKPTTYDMHYRAYQLYYFGKIAPQCCSSCCSTQTFIALSNFIDHKNRTIFIFHIAKKNKYIEQSLQANHPSTHTSFKSLVSPSVWVVISSWSPCSIDLEIKCRSANMLYQHKSKVL